MFAGVVERARLGAPGLLVQHGEIRWKRPTGLREHVLMGYEVRRIRADEWREYRALRLEALKDSPLAFVEQYDEVLANPDRFWQDRVEGSATGDKVATFVARHADRFVGKATCFEEEDVTECASAHVVGVYVTPTFRGRGVAEALMTAVTRWAREQAGAERIRLFVTETNERATAFYGRLGFVRTGETIAYPPDPSYAEHEMERRLP